jgi:hypothetical protein
MKYRNVTQHENCNLRKGGEFRDTLGDYYVPKKEAVGCDKIKQVC